MRKPAAVAVAVAGLGGILAAGFSVGAIASSRSPSTAAAPATTSESTTEHAMSASNLYLAALSPTSETPAAKGASGASGAFGLWLEHKGTKYTASWKLTFSGLTGKATAAHIHTGKPGQSGPVVVPLCGPCKSGDSGTATLSAAVVAAIKNGGAYANVHTAKNPGGEIRGQIH
jgi:CHRD domain